MRVSHVNLIDTLGGAARAASELNRALNFAGVDSNIFVQQKYSQSQFVVGPNSRLGKGIGLMNPWFDSLPLSFYPNRDMRDFSPSILSFPGLIKNLARSEADIVHLHWINGGMIKIEALRKIGSPIVWTLHDASSFTGGCHVVDACQKFIEGCGACRA